MAEKLVLLRKVAKEESGLKKDLRAGTVVYKFEGHTFGVIRNEIPVTLKPGATPFFGIPRNAIYRRYGRL
ncbi:MAG: hypothetical protein Q7S09_03050 [bacterium]|nr:hypothetical protein [bacterium]